MDNLHTLLFSESNLFSEPNPTYVVNSFNIYSDSDISEYRKTRYRSIFSTKYSRDLFIEINVKSKNPIPGIRFTIEHHGEEIYRLHSSLKPRPIFKREIEVIENVCIEDFYNYDTTNFYYTINAYIKYDKIASKEIYIENDIGFDLPQDCYFKLNSIALYRDSQNLIHRVFDINKTRRINILLSVDFVPESYKFHDQFPYEFFIVIRNKSNEKIFEGSFIGDAEWHDYKPLNLKYEIDISDQSLYKKGDYVIEVIFYHELFAKIPVTLTDYDEILDEKEGNYKLQEYKKNNDTDDLNIEEEFEGFVGLEDIKLELKKYSNYVRLLKSQSKNINSGNKPLKFHCLFIGNPGTGKTKVAIVLARILKKIGLLSKGTVYEVGRNHIIGEYIGETAIKTAAAIEKARGGVLLVDEAYSLYNESSGKDYGYEAITVLLKEMSDGPGDICIIAAGYPHEMNTFLKSNPGLKSRLHHIFEFRDYNPDELLQIAINKAFEKDMTISESAKTYLHHQLNEEYRNRKEDFGNARFINTIIERAAINYASRILNTKIEAYIPLRLEKDDFIDIFEKKKYNNYSVGIDQSLLKSSLVELKSLVGVKNIKKDIVNLVTLLNYYREEGYDIDNKISLHSIFQGNPGTGKTTIARILTQIYKALGILEKGHLIECDRSGLVGGYIGQTAIKTSQLIDKAMGGVLFIDEAYSLSKEGINDFGREAIEILLKRMEDDRGKFVVICAGYTNEMDLFLESNPGLKSRFDKFYMFNDYSREELLKICITQFNLYDYAISDETAIEKIQKIIDILFSSRDKYFGNAREIRRLVEQIITNHDLRIASIPKNIRTANIIKSITIQDLDNIAFPKIKAPKQNLGFTIHR